MNKHSENLLIAAVLLGVTAYLACAALAALYGSASIESRAATQEAAIERLSR